MSKRPPLYLIQGGLVPEQHGIYRLRERRAVMSVTETWPKEGEWRRLIRSLMRNPVKGP